jgi:hypothetical protein
MHLVFILGFLGLSCFHSVERYSVYFGVHSNMS